MTTIVRHHTDTDHGATVDVGPALPGDPSDYLTLALRTGERVALTTTCAANALGYAQPGMHAHGNRESATRAFAA